MTDLRSAGGPAAGPHHAAGAHGDADAHHAAGALEAGRHGGDGARLATALGLPVGEVLDLSASLNPFAPDPAPVVARHLDALGRYPDPARAAVALAAVMGVEPGHLLLTNGGAEAIALVARHLGVGRVDRPDFSLYERHLSRTDPDAPRLRSNPHSPSGSLAGAGERAAVWDEAFYPLSTGRWTSGAHLGGATVVGSLTKLLACPGLRIGYVLSADEALLTALQADQPQWAVNGLVAEALPELLASVDLARWSQQIRAARVALAQVLHEHGLRPRPSDAPWLLVDAPHLRARLAPTAVLVRDCTSFDMPGVARIAVPSPAGLRRLDAALRATA